MNFLAPLAVIIVSISAGVTVIIDNSRVKLALLALQYGLIAILIDPTTPNQLIVIKIVTGLIVVLVMYISAKQKGIWSDHENEQGLLTGRIFRMIAVFLVTTSAIGIGRSNFVTIPGIRPEALSAALLLGGLGLLQVSMFGKPPDVAIGLFSLLNGFEIVYGVLESSIAIMTLLAVVHVCIAVVIGIVELDVEEYFASGGDL
ncbi:MAG: hypothetical protein KAH97_01375 [Anaerolineales bacterium]|nr:hypothetical protein [Anaerolineales bacterium]